MFPVPTIRRHPMTSFAVLACAFAWAVYGFAAAGLGTHPENVPLGPVLAALVVTACQGRGALRAWGRTLRRWGGSPRLYVLAVLAPIAIHVLIVAVNTALGAPAPTAEQLGAWPEVPLTWLAMMVLVGLGEEAGWTAFAAPLLLRRHGLLGAWVLLAALRIVWHLPLMLTGQLPWSVGIVGNAAFQLIVLQLVRRGDGPWALAAVWHATLNAFGGAFLFTMVTGEDHARLSLLLALAYGLVALATLVPAAGRREDAGDDAPAVGPVAAPAGSGDRPGVSARRG